MQCPGGFLKLGWQDVSKYHDAVVTFPFATTTTGITGNFDDVDQFTAGYQIATEIVYVYGVAMS
jgi:hypothetical protein